MRKNIFIPVVAIVMLTGMHAMAQSSIVKFTPSKPDTINMITQNGINVSYMQGSLGTAPAIYFIFKNMANSAQNFTWTLKDKNGNAVFGSQQMQIEAGHTIAFDNPDNNMPSASAILNFMYFLSGNATANDYTININH